MKRKIGLFVLAPIALVLVAAGCGSSTGAGSGSANSPGLYGSPAPTSATNGAAGAAKVDIGNSTLGRIVVDGTARTLYLFEKDGNGHSTCYGQCATYWPPLLSRGTPVAGSGATQSLLGTTRRADGTEQVTYAGHPLYQFVSDTQPGQTSGEGSQAFGAGWDALSPTGAKIEADG